MIINENDIELKPLTKEYINLFAEWLNKEYIYKWLCPDGEEEKEAWLNEVNNVDGKYNHFHYFIVSYNKVNIGFCLFTDCFFEKEYTLDTYGQNFDEKYAYEIGYLIGEEEYLGKGIGKIIVKKLEEKIIELGGKEIFADPDEKNIISIKTLLSNGFVKIKNGDYRKKL